MYDADDVIDLCVMEGGKLLEVRPSASASGVVSLPFSFVSSCFRCIKYRHEIAGQIEAINDRLKRIAAENSILRNLQPASQQLHPKKPPPPRETSPLEVEEDIVGAQIEEAADDLINLMLENTEQKCRVFGIVGMGGIGKTTLASKIYNDERIKANIPILVWLYISKDYSEIKLLRVLIRCAGDETKAESFEGESRAELEPKLASLLTENLFLVLDDVWNPNVWTDFLRKPLSKGAGSSTILVTTRIETVLSGMKASYMHRAEKMDDNSGWRLLGKTVFEAGEEDDMRRLEEVGRKIVRKCDGLPLAIKAIAGVLISKDRSTAEWEQVLENDAWSPNRQIDEEVPRALHLSYEDLPSHLKQCFLYCSFFICELFHYKDIIRFWVAEGLIVEAGGRLMEDIAEEYYWELVSRNLLQLDPSFVDRSVFCMHDHDHLRALATYLMKEEGLSITVGQRLDIKANAKIRRLLISNMGIKLVLSDHILEEKCLRTLVIRDSLPTITIEDNVLEGLPNLRVLDLCDTSIERIPNCIGDLLHLRYLDLDRTKIHEIPESIGRLVNLQTLNISGCKHLHRLPMTITRLYNLRSFVIKDTPLTHVPKGIEKLININRLEGFVIGHDNSTNEVDEVGCGLEELQHLSKLRYLSIYRLERAVTAASALAEKRSLRELILSWMPPVDGEDGDATDSGEDRRANRRKEEQIQMRAEKICIELSPPSNLRTLVIGQFPGRQFPNWIMSSSLGKSFPNLVQLELLVFPSCTEFPPLGMLPLLKILRIKGATVVKTIGPEFLGHSFPRTCAFPKLEHLNINDMPNWEEWSLCGVEEGGHRTHLKLFPNLTKCFLQDCPKLRALPEGLSHATNLKELYIWRAHNLREVTKLRLSDLLVRDNKMLSRISNVAMKYLKVMDCPSLEYVDNLDKLQHVVLICPEHMDQLPQWLSRLIDQQHPNSAQWGFRKLEVHCNIVLLRSCLEGNEHWNIIQRIPDVKFQTFSKEYMRYIKDPYKYDTNVPPE
uniref:Uncharacterized protein n=1 Tax=Musa acuminata subsp. malaccensis TaxID=214687 RepID=A0A804KTY5_MUSAM|nr:PREDICTED: putative disease resistance RPP13-like protein 1 [Musa acuminata subsp. malaccensis]